MAKLSSSVLLIAFIFVFLGLAQAQVITLKSGRTFNGEITERAKDYIKVKYNGLEVYYENKYIQSIEDQQPDVPVAVTPQEKVAQDPVFSFKKGVELAAAGNFNEARKEFSRQLNDIEGALSILDAVEKGSMSKEFASYLFQGSLCMLNKEYSLAVVSLEKAWEIDPKDPDLNYNLSSAYYSLGEYKKSIVYSYAVLKLQPLDVEAYELIVKAYCNTGEYQKAKECLSNAKELLSKNGDGDGVARIDKLLQAVAEITP